MIVYLQLISSQINGGGGGSEKCYVQDNTFFVLFLTGEGASIQLRLEHFGFTKIKLLKISFSPFFYISGSNASIETSAKMFVHSFKLSLNDSRAYLIVIIIYEKPRKSLSIKNYSILKISNKNRRYSGIILLIPEYKQHCKLNTKISN